MLVLLFVFLHLNTDPCDVRCSVQWIRRGYFAIQSNGETHWRSQKFSSRIVSSRSRLGKSRVSCFLYHCCYRFHSSLLWFFSHHNTISNYRCLIFLCSRVCRKRYVHFRAPCYFSLFKSAVNVSLLCINQMKILSFSTVRIFR